MFIQTLYFYDQSRNLWDASPSASHKLWISWSIITWSLDLEARHCKMRSCHSLPNAPRMFRVSDIPTGALLCALRSACLCVWHMENVPERQKGNRQPAGGSRGREADDGNRIDRSVSWSKSVGDSKRFQWIEKQYVIVNLRYLVCYDTVKSKGTVVKYTMNSRCFIYGAQFQRKINRSKVILEGLTLKSNHASKHHGKQDNNVLGKCSIVAFVQNDQMFKSMIVSCDWEAEITSRCRKRGSRDRYNVGSGRTLVCTQSIWCVPG